MASKLVIFAYFLGLLSITAANNTIKLRSVLRTNMKQDCYLLNVHVDSNGKPELYNMKGHCCHDEKYTDFELTKYATSNGLEAAFQWSHDPTYYLTANNTGKPFRLEKLSNGVTPSQKFIITTTNTCSFCVKLQSVSTKKYLASTIKGGIAANTNPKVMSIVFQVHSCPQGIKPICPFLTVACT